MIRKRLRKVAADLYKRWTLHYLYPSRYRKLAGKKPVQKNKVVFLEVRMEALSDNFLPVYQAMVKSGRWQIKCVFLRQDMAGRKTVRRLSLAALEELCDARFIIVNDSSYLLGSLPLRPQTKVLQLWHACGAFKKFGYSLTGKKFGSEKKELDRFPLYRNFTWVTVSSPEVAWAYAEAFHLPQERIIPTGIARTDVFFDEQAIWRAKEKLTALLPECFAPGRRRRIVLYAPTFRGRVSTAAAPKPPDFVMLQQMLGDDWLFLCKHHPFVKERPLLPAGTEDFVRDMTDLMTIDELLMVSDVCVSDYSSLIFEFSLYERPMAFYAPDLADYDDWRGFYYPYEEMTPGPVLRTTKEVGAYLLDLSNRFDRARVHDFRQRFMSACDGKATDRILKLLSKPSKTAHLS